MMRTAIPEKLLTIAAEIKERGSANLTRLTVLKKWFEHSHRLSSFAIFIAKRAIGKKEKTTGEAAKLFPRCPGSLERRRCFLPRGVQKTSRKAARKPPGLSKWAQETSLGNGPYHQKSQPVFDRGGLRIYLWHSKFPQEGYRLTAKYCEHYDPSQGNSLNGPSYTKIREIVRFMFTTEAIEDI